MDFREYAAKEASDFAARLTAAAATAAADAAAHAAKRADDEAQKVIDALRRDVQAVVDDKTATLAHLRDAQAHGEQLQAQLTDTRAHGENLQAQLKDAQGRADHLQAELEAAQGHAGLLHAQLNEQLAQGEQLRAQLSDAQGQRDQLRAQLNDAHANGEHLRAQLNEVEARSEQLQAERDAARTMAEQLHAELLAAHRQVEQLNGQVQGAQAYTEDLQRQLASAIEVADETRRRLEEVSARADMLEASRTELTAASDEQTIARRVAEKELRTALGDIDALRGELASAMRTLEQASSERLASDDAAASANEQLRSVEARLEAASDQLIKSEARAKALEQAQRGHERTIADLESKLQSARSAPAPSAAPSAASGILEDLLVGFQALGGATTIADVLTTLVEQMAAQFPRVALFRVKKGHLQGEHQIGFENYTDIAKLVLPLGMDSLPSRSASSGEIEILSGDALKGQRTPFNGSPAFAVAVPIVVGGETMAVAYADDSGVARSARGGEIDEARARYADGMQRYAVALIMRLTNELKALAELQRYAASLLQEIEQMYEADVQAGKTGDLRKRLTGNLDYARSIYASRAAIEGAGAAALIEDEVGALVEARAGTPFARDLAAAAGLGERNAAEAS